MKLVVIKLIFNCTSYAIWEIFSFSLYFLTSFRAWNFLKVLAIWAKMFRNLTKILTCSTICLLNKKYFKFWFQRAQEWRAVFWVTFAVYSIGTLLFCLLVSGEKQEWANFCSAPVQQSTAHAKQNRKVEDCSADNL